MKTIGQYRWTSGCRSLSDTTLVVNEFNGLGYNEICVIRPMQERSYKNDERDLPVAELIASAPELLAALEALLPFVEDQVSRGQVDGQDTSHYGDAKAVAVARAAIAKARGGAK